MLMHHPYARVYRVFGRMELYLLPMEPDFTAVRGLHSVQDVHQCRLSCSVFADEAVDLAFSDREINMIARQDTRVLFDNIDHFYSIHILPFLFP